MSERSTRYQGQGPTDGQYRNMGGARATPGASQGGSNRSRSVSATPVQSPRPALGNLSNQIPPSLSQQASKKSRKQPTGTRDEQISALEKQAEQERARAVAAEAKLARMAQENENAAEENRRLQLEAAERPPAAAQRRDDEDDDDDEEEPEVIGRKRKRKPKSVTEFRRSCQYYTYFHCLYLTSLHQHRIFTQHEKGEGRQAELFEGALDVFDCFDDHEFSTLNENMGDARSEAKMRINQEVLKIFDITNSDLNNKDSTFRRNAASKLELGWTFHDFPECKRGIYQSDLLIKCMSALLYGPDSITKETAGARAASGGGSKGALWDPPRISPGFLAFTCTVVCHVFRGEKSFRMTDVGRKKRKNRNRNVEIYEQVLENLRKLPQAEEILDYLTRKLIPDPEDTEEPQQDPIEAWDELLQPDVGAFVAEDEEQPPVELGSGGE